MYIHKEIIFNPLLATPKYFDEDKFKTGDEIQMKMYKDSKIPNQKKVLTYEQILKEKYNYARQVPMGGCFIDYDNKEEFEIMKRIIVRAELKCFILKTQRGGQFLFRLPIFYKKELTGATNWFGYKFDSKASWVNEKREKVHAVQNIKVCGMERIEVASWDLGTPIPPDTINIDELDILPFWLWGKGKDEKLFKDGKMGKIKDPDTGKELPAHNYKIDDSPFTELMKMTEGGRHDYIFKYCRTFALYNGFLLDDFKAIIHAIHDEFLAKIGTPMSDTDLLGDVDKGWEKYKTELISDYHGRFDELKRVWSFEKEKTKDKLDERRATEYLYGQYDFYVRSQKANGVYNELLYREKDGDYEYKTDLPTIRQTLKEYSDQNFRTPFFEEVEKQLMQMCVENEKLIKRSNQYVLAKNKVLRCVSRPEAYDFSWLGTRPPTDVVFRWTWQSEQWVEEHREDLGGLITKFIKDLSRNSKGIPQPEVEQWLYIIAGACMIPANELEKIVILSGGGQNGKSLYTSLIRLCLGENMFNTSRIFDCDPQEKFWGAELDKGICCIVDDLPQNYNKNAFSYIKGAITKSEPVEINEKFKPKKKLDVLPQIIACTNFDFKLYDKTKGMRRRVLILPTECHIEEKDKDINLQYKLVLNTTDTEKIDEYKMSEDSLNNSGIQIMKMHTGEKGVLDSLEHGSLCWFANYSRYEYFRALKKEFAIGDSYDMKNLLDDTFKNEFEIQCEDFINWYVNSKCGTVPDRNLSLANDYLKNIYPEYEPYCEIKGTVNKMTDGQLKKFCSPAIINLGYKIENKKMKKENGKYEPYRYVVFGERVAPSKKK